MMDWLATLGAQDQSLEALLARRDLSKSMGQALQVANAGEDRRQFDENQQRQRDALKEQIALRRAQQDETFRMREEAKADRDKADKLQRYNTMHDNLAPGQEVGKDQADLIREFEGPGSLTSTRPPVGPIDPESPEGFVYKKRQFEDLQLAQQRKEEDRQREITHQQEQDAREEAHLKLAQKASDMASAREDRMKAAADAKKKTADAMLTQLPAGPLRAGAIDRAKQIIASQSSLWSSLNPWEAEANKMDAYVQAYQEALDKMHAMNPALASTPTPHVPGVGGRGAGTGAPPNETPQARRDRLILEAKNKGVVE